MTSPASAVAPGKKTSEFKLGVVVQAALGIIATPGLLAMFGVHLAPEQQQAAAEKVTEVAAAVSAAHAAVYAVSRTVAKLLPRRVVTNVTNVEQSIEDKVAPALGRIEQLCEAVSGLLGTAAPAADEDGPSPADVPAMDAVSGAVPPAGEPKSPAAADAAAPSDVPAEAAPSTLSLAVPAGPFTVAGLPSGVTLSVVDGQLVGSNASV